MKRRDLWYQIWDAQSNAWRYGGTVTEEFSYLSNPCNLTITQGLGGAVNGNAQFSDVYYSNLAGPPPQPQCALTAIQRYKLSSAYNAMILEQTWRWDTTGVWRQ
jgi:hypothetical protein